MVRGVRFLIVFGCALLCVCVVFVAWGDALGMVVDARDPFVDLLLVLVRYFDIVYFGALLFALVFWGASREFAFFSGLGVALAACAVLVVAFFVVESFLPVAEEKAPRRYEQALQLDVPEYFFVYVSDSATQDSLRLFSRNAAHHLASRLFEVRAREFVALNNGQWVYGADPPETRYGASYCRVNEEWLSKALHAFVSAEFWKNLQGYLAYAKTSFLALGSENPDFMACVSIVCAVVLGLACLFALAALFYSPVRLFNSFFVFVVVVCVVFYHELLSFLPGGYAELGSTLLFMPSYYTVGVWGLLFVVLCVGIRVKRGYVYRRA